MARKKLNLAYIANPSMRKAAFNKRKKGLIKKVNELSVLCGIEACAMIYSPLDSNSEVWPSNSGVEKVVKKFEMLSEMDQGKRMVNHEEFLRQSISKVNVNNNKRMRDNSEKMMKEAMFHLFGGGEKLTLTDGMREDLCQYIDQYLKELYHHKNQILNQSNLEYGGSSSAASTTIATTTNTAQVFNSSSRATNDLPTMMTPTISLNHIPQQLVPYNQHLNINLNNHNVLDITMGSQEGWLVSAMMDEQMGFPIMDDDDNNNRFDHQQF